MVRSGDQKISDFSIRILIRRQSKLKIYTIFIITFTNLLTVCGLKHFRWMLNYKKKLIHVFTELQIIGTPTNWQNYSVLVSGIILKNLNNGVIF